MHIIDPDKFKRALRGKGYSSIGALAKGLKIHRNTIHHYLSGSGVLPESIDKILDALDLKLGDLLTKKEDDSAGSSLEPVAKTVDILSKEFGDITFVLFGSRAKGISHKYSDWDIGVYKDGEFSHSDYRKIIRKKDELVEGLPFFVDVVNLNRADQYFLNEAAKDWIFLGGSFEGWLKLNRKVAA